MDKFICPVCGEKLGADNAPTLQLIGNSVKCPKNHSFDRAAKGYLNLLLSQHKNVKDPGDSKEMVAARRDFLNSGAYQPLLEGLCRAAEQLTEGVTAPVIADCGCGEGYYTAGTYRHLEKSGKSPEIYGIDISKNALSAMGARIKSLNIHTAVASVFRLPLKTGCADLAAVVFAPFQREELLRILKEGGCVMTAIPAERHLFGLKQLIYDKPYLNEVKPYEIEGLEFLGADEVAYNLEITSQEQLNALFMMTPYYYKTSPRDSNRVYSYFGTNGKFETEISFQILKYRKRK